MSTPKSGVVVETTTSKVVAVTTSFGAAQGRYVVWEDGRDILIGGTGADQIVGDEQDDILIVG